MTRFARPLAGLCLLVVPVLGVAVVGCSDDGPNPGALGKGSFRYRCLDDSDGACETAGIAPTFPTLVGVGGELSLSFVASGDDAPSGAVFPASPSLLAPTSQGFRAVKAGSVGVLARESDSSTVLDFTTVVLRDVGGLGFVDAAVSESARPGGEPLALTVGEPRTIEAFAVDDAGKPLAGAFAYAWSAGSPGTAALADGAGGRQITVEGKKAGAATITVHIPNVVSPVTIALEVREP